MYNTLNNPSAHPSYSHYYLLSPSTLFFFVCTSGCFLHIWLFFAHLIVFCTFFYFIAHFTLISPFLTICMPLCYVTLYNLYSYYFALSTEQTWFDYISLLIIPCITIMWQIKKPCFRCHMDYFIDVLTTFLCLDRGSTLAVYWGSENTQISSQICSFVFRR